MASQEGQKGYITDMLTENDEPNMGLSEIASFYAGCSILVTGASGFLGRLLVEKILRSCPNVEKIYMFMRTKKGKSPKERFVEYFDDVIYERLKQEQPQFGSKVMLVEGDMAKSDLGLSPESRELLRGTNIVLHCAATVRFDAKLRAAVNINVRATKELLLLAKEMRNLKAFVHVSTAYSHCIINEIDEKFYPPAMSTEQIISLVDLLDDNKLDQITSILLEKWPNAYTFTKAVAEDTVRNHSNEIPVCIVRPSMVIPTSKEPIAGWINNIYGPTGITAAAGVGLLRTLHTDENSVADIIPADYVINLIIVAAWDTARANNIKLNKVDSIVEEFPIYNGVSSSQKPITWGQYMKLNEFYGLRIQSVNVLWYYCFTLNKHLWAHKLQDYFLHLIPAAIVDSLAYATGREPALLNAYKKISALTEACSHFGTRQWRFYNRRVQNLWNKINATDQSIFNFNMESHDWNDYLRNHIRGIRVYIMKDPLDTVARGNAKYAKLRVAHYTLVTVLLGLMLWVFVTILRTLGLW